MLYDNVELKAAEANAPKVAAQALVGDLRKTFYSGLTYPYAYRQQQLRNLDTFFKEKEQDIKAALYEDLRKPSQEVLSTEILILRKEIGEVLKNLAKWLAPQKVSTLLAAQPGHSYTKAEPLGLVLIIAPWNYPFQLALMPLIGAIAAGNCVILKPSELAPASSKLMAQWLPHYLDKACYKIIEGGIEETTALLNERFDHIFFTGSSSVGKIVMQAAVKHLTPVTLELGGKSPCLVNDDANIRVAVDRILWGKFSNAGQTCIAPDYVLVHEKVAAVFIQSCLKRLKEFYGAEPEKNPDYARIINLKHYHRLMNLIPESGEIVTGGFGYEKIRYIAPTILKNVSLKSPIMQEAAEIFGPILPIICVKNIEEAVTIVRAREKPLALYLFTEKQAVQRYVEKFTSSGSFVVNHTMLSVAILTLPFGGVGHSGMGAYHGKASFDTFSHQKAVLVKPTWRFDIPSLVIYPPYSKLKEKLLKWVF